MVLTHYKYTLAKGVQKARTKTAIALSAMGLLIGSSGMSLALIGTVHASPYYVANCSFDKVANTWTLQHDCTSSTSEITVPANTVVNGNGYTIASNFAMTNTSNNAALGVVGNNVTIKNLTIDGTRGTKLHGINVYESTGVVLDNVTLANNARNGLVVNGSDVTVNNLTTKNNGWGGVDVDQGSGVTTPAKLTVTGTSKHAEVSGADIYVDNTSKAVSVVDTAKQYVVTKNVKQAGDALYTLLNVSLAKPSSNAVLAGTTTFAGTVNVDTTDGLRGGALQLSFRPVVNGIVQNPLKTFSVPVAVSSTNQWTYNVPTTQLPDGPYLVVARATDTSGTSYATSRTVAATINVVVDNTAPVVHITNPANGATVAGTVDIRGSITDANPDHYYLRIANSSNQTVYDHVYYGGEQTFTNHSIYSWNTANVPDGTYTVLLAARDAAGNRGANSEDMVTVKVNNTPDTMNQCKDSGWTSFTKPAFRNQGLCVSWVEHNVLHHGMPASDKPRHE